MGRKSNYENGIYQQLMEIMGRLDTVEKESAQKINTLNNRIDTLENENILKSAYTERLDQPLEIKEDRRMKL